MKLDCHCHLGLTELVCSMEESLDAANLLALGLAIGSVGEVDGEDPAVDIPAPLLTAARRTLQVTGSMEQLLRQVKFGQAP
jgi:hypothetical protein